MFKANKALDVRSDVMSDLRLMIISDSKQQNNKKKTKYVLHKYAQFMSA